MFGHNNPQVVMHNNTQKYMYDFHSASLSQFRNTTCPFQSLMLVNQQVVKHLTCVMFVTRTTNSALWVHVVLITRQWHYTMVHLAITVSSLQVSVVGAVTLTPPVYNVLDGQAVPVMSL